MRERLHQRFWLAVTVTALLGGLCGCPSFPSSGDEDGEESTPDIHGTWSYSTTLSNRHAVEVQTSAGTATIAQSGGDLAFALSGTWSSPTNGARGPETLSYKATISGTDITVTETAVRFVVQGRTIQARLKGGGFATSHYIYCINTLNLTDDGYLMSLTLRR